MCVCAPAPRPLLTPRLLPAPAPTASRWTPTAAARRPTRPCPTWTPRRWWGRGAGAAALGALVRAPPDAPPPPPSQAAYARRDEAADLRRAFDLLAAPDGAPGRARGAPPSPAITPASLGAFIASTGATLPAPWAADAVWEADDDGDGVVAWPELAAAATRARGAARAAEPRALVDVATFAATADPRTWRLAGDVAAAAAHARHGRGAALAAALGDFCGGDPAASVPASLSLADYLAAAARAQARAVRGVVRAPTAVGLAAAKAPAKAGAGARAKAGRAK